MVSPVITLMRRSIKIRRVRTGWIVLLNALFALVLVAFAFDVWTDRPIRHRLVLQGIQIGIAGFLLLGIIFELRNGSLARRWNLSAQIAASAFPALAFAYIAFEAKLAKIRLDGMETMLLVFSFWMLFGSGISWVLYKRSATLN
jgi:hypothetical protein